LAIAEIGAKPIKPGRADPVRPRQSLRQNIMVHRIEGGREIEQTKQRMVARINRLCDICHHLQQSGLSRVEPPVSRLMDRQKARRRQVSGQLDAGDVLEKLRQERQVRDRSVARKLTRGKLRSL